MCFLITPFPFFFSSLCFNLFHLLMPMEDPPNLRFLLSKLNNGLILAAFLLSLHLPQALSLSSFSPLDHYLINCGSSSPITVDPDNRRYRGDQYSGFGSVPDPVSLSATRSLLVRDPNPSSRDLPSSPIYLSARIFTTPSNYAFRIRDKGAHLIRLHFHWFNSKEFDLTDVQFHVAAGGFLLLRNFSAQARENILIKEYIVPVDGDELIISFLPSKGSKLGFINAIEVISAPKDLILDTVQFVNSTGVVKFSGFSKNALETVYRVSVGGPKVTPFNDSLWRTWIPDDGFLQSSNEAERVHSSGRIRYQSGGSSREVAPDNIYNSARVIRSKNSGVPNSTIMLSFPVMKGYRYLVRAHFCDIASITSGMLIFNVYVNGYLGAEDVEPLLVTPFYADLVVDVDDDWGPGVVNVSVGASKWSSPREIVAILNGVEVMKVNNSMGSLDGELSAELIIETGPSLGFLVPVVAVICLLVAASVLLQRRMFGGVRAHASWSRIPADVPEMKSCVTR